MNTNIDEVIAKLMSRPKSLKEATGPNGLPRGPGLYAWWTRRSSIPSVPRCPHPTESELDLFYVGISPKRATSSATIRSRVTSNHMRGNTGGSTFRLSLASLLFEEKGWQPVMADRPLLTKENNNALSAWQHEHLRLTWATHPEPWAIEHEVIARLGPPLNIEGSAQEFSSTVSAARSRFKEAASGGTNNPIDPEERPVSVIGPSQGEELMRTGRTQPVTAADKRSGQIRIPTTGITKNLFPSEKGDVALRFLSHEVTVGWDPRTGPDRERSGVIRFRGSDKDLLREGVGNEQVLTVKRKANGEIAIS